jgi:hypothetical protein
MEISQRNQYLGFETDPDESKKFKIRFAICLIFIAMATVLLLTQETRNLYKGKIKITTRKANRAGRKVRNLFEL